MNYELAKKLKDAGFPDSKSWVRGDVEGFSKEIMVDRCAGGIRSSPDLSDLIEACGDGFYTLTKIKKNSRAYEVGCKWHAYNTEEGFGSTPEEAVADLWLELNKK